MSESDFINRWAEQASDRLNPILVKETRQALKSKQFLATFAIMLLGGWLISAFVLMSMIGANDESPIGKNVFPWYFTLLSFTVMLVVPFGAFRSLLAERDLNTYELLNITTLSPQQIVWGKWLSAQVQTFIYFSAISPFVAFTYLLRGVDFPTLIFVLLALMFASMLVALMSLTFSTFARQRQAQVVLSLVLLGQLVWIMGASITTGTLLVSRNSIDFSDPAVYWGGLVIGTYYVALFVLCLQIARAQLTFESDNRSTGIRLSGSAIFWLTIGWLSIGFHQGYFGGTSPSTNLATEPIYSTLSVLAVFWGAVCVFAATETETLSRRVRGQLPKNPLVRLIAVPFLPGGGRGMLLAVGHLAALIGLAFLVQRSLHGPDRVHAMNFTSAVSCYIIIYAGLAAVMGRWLRSATPLFRPAQTRAFAIVMFAVMWMVPNIFTILRGSGRTTNELLYLTDPVHSLVRVSGGGPWAGKIMMALSIAASLVVLLNLRTMLRGLAEVVLLREPPPDVPEVIPDIEPVSSDMRRGVMLDSAVAPEPSTTS